MMKKEIDFSILINQILIDIKINKIENEIIFVTNTGNKYLMMHEDDCCESVYIEDITGYLLDLLNSPILQAEEVSNQEDEIDGYTHTWTFYKVSTIKGSVTIRWYGTSNGYYSEKVSFFKIE